VRVSWKSCVVKGDERFYEMREIYLPAKKLLALAESHCSIVGMLVVYESQRLPGLLLPDMDSLLPCHHF
jgi:hypothetical protein